MASLSPQTYQFINQINTLRYIDVTTGPEGAHGVTSYWLVPTGHWHNGQRFSHDVVEDLAAQDFKKTSVEGVEYYLVPEESTNLPGRLSHYAQLTGVAELQNPSGGGVNRVRETLEASAAATVDPEGVAKYVENNDTYEEARKKKSEEDSRVERQVTVSPAREPAEGALVETAVSEPAKADDSKSSTSPASSKAASTSKSA